MSPSFRGHVREEDEHLLVLVHCEIFGCGEGHVRDEEPFHRRLFRGVDEADDLVKGAGPFEFMSEIQIVVVGKSHAAENYLVHICPQGHLGHHIVVRLVRVGEERDLLS